MSQSRGENQLWVHHAVFEPAQLLKILDILVVGNKDGYLEWVAILLISDVIKVAFDLQLARFLFRNDSKGSLEYLSEKRAVNKEPEVQK